ncbi:unnamed protein product [Urochloa humidicola]
MSNLDSPAAAAERGEAKQEPAAASVPASDATPKRKKKKLKTKNKMQEQQESPTDLDSTVPAEAEYQGETKGRKMEGLEATDAAASALNGTPKCNKKKKKKNRTQEQQELLPDLDSMALAEAEYQGEARERGMEALEATDAAASVFNGTQKCKKTKKKNKVQEQPECPHELDSTTPAELEYQGGMKGRGMEELEATDSAACGFNRTPKCKKKIKKKNKMQEQQECPHELDSMATAEAEEQGGTKGRGMEVREATDAAASALNWTPKSKKEKNTKIQEQQESPPDLKSTGAAEAEEWGEVKGREMEEHEAADATSSALNGSLKCNNNNNNKKNYKQVQQETPPDLYSASAAEAEEHGRGMKEATNAAASVLEEIPKFYKEEATVKDSVMLKEEATSTVVSDLEGTPQLKKRKRKNMTQKGPESKLASLGVVGANQIVSNKSENGCSDGVEASGHTDVSMDSLCGEDPSCDQSNANVAGVSIENCSENSSLLQESSAGRKRRKRKRKRGSPNRWPVLSSENGEIVGMHSLDSSTHHDLSCICSSCPVEAREQKNKNIYSPRGSLVRFRRKKLLILDLNGLLADINQDFHNAHKAHGKVRGKLVFRRPYSDDFLRFCFQNFELGIWSSRKRENVDSVVNILMQDLKKYILFCWDMSYCTVTGCNTVDNKHKPLVLKELKKLWNKEEPTLPWELGEFSPSNTLLVDDSPYKALCNPPNTAIFPQPYSYRNERDDYSLGPGGDLRIYLERIASADDVQNYVRDNPFGQNSITESDPNWNFYVQIVDKVEKQIVNKGEKRIVDKVENQIVDTVERSLA